VGVINTAEYLKQREREREKLSWDGYYYVFPAGGPSSERVIFRTRAPMIQPRVTRDTLPLGNYRANPRERFLGMRVARRESSVLTARKAIPREDREPLSPSRT
jgi:hypothetical protein